MNDTKTHPMMDQTIAQLEEKLRQAMLSSDVSTLDALIADELIFTMFTGQVFGKQDDLTAYRTGLQKVTRVEFSDRQICHYETFSIVTVQADMTGIFHDEPFAGTYRYLRVWAKVNGQWQIVAGNVSQVAAS